MPNVNLFFGLFFVVDLKTIGHNIAKIRISKNMSARELSFQLGKNGDYMYKVESGKFNVGIQTLFNICKILEVDIVDILEEE